MAHSRLPIAENPGIGAERPNRAKNVVALKEVNHQRLRLGCHSVKPSGPVDRARQPPKWNPSVIHDDYTMICICA
ncbi:uncharacterized protein Dsimw501_GD29255 [Drosophila simulans]|nr:uncharacterized protein Dsimw501_GD29255 [Drosophila simulans]